MARSSQRRETASKAVALRGVSIAPARRTFGISETYYRHGAKLNEENKQIADMLTELTRAKKSWGIAGTTSAYTASWIEP